jgi:hypothetical protein
MQSGEAVFVIVEGWLEFMVETEPRGFKSKPGGAMKSSAMMPGAIWWLPRREVGWLREVVLAKMSTGVRVGDGGPPKGECQVGREALRPALAGEV